MNFPTRLREMRRRKNLSQTELGKRIGLHYIQIGRYEKGTAQPTSEVLVKLAQELEVSIDYLMTGKIISEMDGELQDQHLIHQFKQIEQLDQEDKKVVKTLLDAFLLKKQIQKMSN